jgi:hypothetical protein
MGPFNRRFVWLLHKAEPVIKFLISQAVEPETNLLFRFLS